MRLIIILAALLAISCTNTAQSPLGIGDKAPAFNLKNVDGTMVSLEEGKAAIVVFTCNHCPYAVMYEDRLIDLHTKYAPLGYPVIAINPNDPEVKPGDSFEAMKVRAAEKGFNFPYIFDDGQKIYPQYGATKTPHVFLLDQFHNVRYIGAIDDSARDAEAVEVKFLEDAINALIDDGTPDPETTKAIGCSIKTKS